jgi:predicted RNase H-like nuclease
MGRERFHRLNTPGRSVDGYRVAGGLRSTVSVEATRSVGTALCADGWVAVVHRGDGFDHAAVFAEFGALWGRYEEAAEHIAVPVPVGLRERGEEPRPPDRLARELLGPRRSAVYDAPVREATRKQRYQTASRVNERKAGRRLAREAFDEAAAVAEIDELLSAIPEARPVVMEAHPELCFRAFRGEPLEYDGRTAAGYAERLRTLAEFDPDAPVDVVAASEATGGHDVAVADVLDATGLALTVRPGEGELRSLPEDPPTDSEGLPMRMVYRSGTALSP